VRFAPVNANYAALTARAAKREGPPRRAFASFFQAEITPEKRNKVLVTAASRRNSLTLWKAQIFVEM